MNPEILNLHAQRNSTRIIDYTKIFKNHAEAVELKREFEILKAVPEYELIGGIIGTHNP